MRHDQQMLTRSRRGTRDIRTRFDREHVGEKGARLHVRRQGLASARAHHWLRICAERMRSACQRLCAYFSEYMPT